MEDCSSRRSTGFFSLIFRLVFLGKQAKEDKNKKDLTGISGPPYKVKRKGKLAIFPRQMRGCKLDHSLKYEERQLRQPDELVNHYVKHDLKFAPVVLVRYLKYKESGGISEEQLSGSVGNVDAQKTKKENNGKSEEEMADEIKG